MIAKKQTVRGHLTYNDNRSKFECKAGVYPRNKKEFIGGILMNKTELVTAIAGAAKLSKKDAEAALKAFIDVVSQELKKGGKVQLVGFGTFEVSKRAAREGRNPQTGKTMKIAASKAPKFKAGKALKDLVNK